jgi:uncharacterized protein YbjT (DUF2867 family)
MQILVTGASGVLGGAMLSRLRPEGHDVRGTSRRPNRQGWFAADMATGDGLAEAVAGVDAVVHLASATTRYRNAGEVDVAGTRRLVTAAAQAGVRHLVYVSIVGVDRVPFGYFRHKLAAEAVVRSGPVPWSILRVTQFHQLLDERLLPAAGRLGVVLGDPEIAVQPVDPRDVADRIADLLAAGPSHAVENYGGPEVLPYADIVKPWLRARGRRRPLLMLRLPGRMMRAMRAGALTTMDRPTGIRTWREYLTEKYGPVADSQA